ncbi:DUF6519 domain-containing protein [Streptomyces sp. NPDC008001]|uniref:DUF6519 domain-containing protein n=1 Tax=Streptomyces sp. NPDC008001 TaxID=3364804 RepID=UPI0036F0DD25
MWSAFRSMMSTGSSTAPGGTRLHRVTDIDHTARYVFLDADPDQDAGTDPALHPVLRRWDHRPPESADGEGAIVVQEDTWLSLEDGVAVRFSREDPQKPCVYRSGDYWLIPARAVTSDVEWPTDPQGKPVPKEPHGVHYHYAPLAVVKPAEPGDEPGTRGIRDLRTPFPQPSPPRLDQA